MRAYKVEKEGSGKKGQTGMRGEKQETQHSRQVRD
jgi:hypothetical protein